MGERVEHLSSRSSAFDLVVHGVDCVGRKIGGKKGGGEAICFLFLSSIFLPLPPFVTEGNFPLRPDCGDKVASVVSSQVTVWLSKVMRDLFSKKFLGPAKKDRRLLKRFDLANKSKLHSKISLVHVAIRLYRVTVEKQFRQ
jgi:hypothetical protein